MWAHVRNEYLRLGWDGRGRMLEWHPTWAEAQLSEDRVVQAWLLGRIRTGLRIRCGGQRAEEEGEEEAVEEAAHRGPALWGPGSMEFTADGAKLAAAGVRTWRDVSHSTGRWMTWAEVKAAESPSAIRGEACKRAYRAVMAHLGERMRGRGRGTRA